MAVWAAIPMIASMGVNAFGAYSAGQTAESGAKSTANIERMNREYQTKTFNKAIERQKPFTEAGAAAIPRYMEAVKGRGAPMEGGLAQMQKKMIEEDTAGFTGYNKDMAMKRLEGEEGQKEKARLMDMMQIGLGSSGSAGSSAVNLGSSLSSSYGRAGGANIIGSMNKAVSEQNMWSQSLDSLSGVAAYYAANRGKSSGGSSSGSVAPFTTPNRAEPAPYQY